MAQTAHSQDYTIAALWMEGALSYLEQLCLKSFVDAGHHVKLYHYGPLQNVPEGIELANADDILPRTDFLTHQRTGSPALHSDLFRYKMLAKSKNTIWADTDAYCMRKFETPNGHFYGWESSKHINGGVLGLPPDSDTLRELLDYTADEFAIPTWYGEDYVRELEEAREAGNPVHASEQPWGVWGPHAVTHFLHKTGEARFALPQEGLYPFTFKDRRMMLKRNFDTSPYVTENTYSVHLYGRRMRARLVEREGGVPHPKSLLGRLLEKHEVNPDLAPLPKPKGERKKPVKTKVERKGRGQVNLTDLADALEVDRGSSKHRYTELYQMLFLPFREKKINFLEMAPLDGGLDPETAGQRPIDSVPAMKMWLDYFPKARIFGVDDVAYSWDAHDRFTFMQNDLNSQAAAQDLATDLPELDIVVDDGSHASHHQQNAFLALFPKLRPGGLYVIEDLRWQPPQLEQNGLTKTGELFSAYQTSGQFQHSDLAVQDTLNNLRQDISGCFVFQVGFNKKKRDQLVVIHKR